MKVVKTIKLFVGGEFIRSESGRTLSIKEKKTGDQYARICKASKKDFKGTVEKAVSGFETWSKKSDFNRSQILYRMAEMTESKRAEFSELFIKTLGVTPAKANKLVDEGIDTFVYYAGFCDKYSALISSVNPVAGRMFNTTSLAPMGVVTLLEKEEFSFSALIDQISSILVGGNSLIVILNGSCPGIIGPLSEVIATSDVPAGSINLLSGELAELNKVISSHGELSAISFQSTNKKCMAQAKELAADSMTRVIGAHKNERCLENIVNYVEQKTLWQSVGK